MRLMSQRSHGLRALAAQFAVAHGHRDVDGLHILRVMTETEPIHGYIRNTGSHGSGKSVEARLPEKAPDQAGMATPLTPSAQRALLDAARLPGLSARPTSTRCIYSSRPWSIRRRQRARC